LGCPRSFRPLALASEPRHAALKVCHARTPLPTPWHRSARCQHTRGACGLKVHGGRGRGGREAKCSTANHKPVLKNQPLRRHNSAAREYNTPVANRRLSGLARQRVACQLPHWERLDADKNRFAATPRQPPRRAVRTTAVPREQAFTRANRLAGWKAPNGRASRTMSDANSFRRHRQNEYARQ